MTLLTVLALLTQAAAQAPSSGIIQGIVVKSGTSEPLAKAAVEVRADDGRTPEMPVSPSLTIPGPAPLLPARPRLKPIVGHTMYIAYAVRGFVFILSRPPP